MRNSYSVIRMEESIDIIWYLKYMSPLGFNLGYWKIPLTKFDRYEKIFWRNSDTNISN